MYLSEKFFDWPYGEAEGTGIDFAKMLRGHEVWRHAQRRLKDNPSEFDRVDCISSLKRAVNSRLKTLDDEYGLNRLPSLRSKKQVLEKYQDYGLIRPSILKDLFEVRNLLEHGDVSPPEIEMCQYYVDIVWYFLKSTDSLLQMKCDFLQYEEGDSELFIGADSDWNVDFNGIVEAHLLSEMPKPGFIEIVGATVEKVKDKANMVSVAGALKMTDELKIRFARDYFGALGYWYEDHA
mgnify:CR=1 FL=1